MKSNILKSMIRTILGVFLLAAAVMLGSGVVPNEKVKQETESVNAESSEATFAAEIGGQSAPRSPSGGLAIYTPIGGTEVPKPKLPRATIAIMPESVNDQTNAGVAADIGGPQTAPRDRGG